MQGSPNSWTHTPALGRTSRALDPREQARRPALPGERAPGRTRSPMKRWKARSEPSTRYVHPHALRDGEGRHDFGLDVVNERVTNYPRWIADLCAPYLGAHV